MLAMKANDAQGFICPYCKSSARPRQEVKISHLGWILLFIAPILPICILGILLKDRYHVCEDCGIRLD